MSYNATIIEVMVASPSDVPLERQLIRDVVREWNSINSRDKETVLVPLSWEFDVAPLMGRPPQDIINTQILVRCDLLVGVFWTRIGTPTEKSASGTVDEIEKHIAQGKPAMLYFSSAKVQPDKIDHDQYKALTLFKKNCELRGLIECYSSVDEFKEKFSRQLAITINENEYIKRLLNREVHVKENGSIDERTPAAGRATAKRSPDELFAQAFEVFKKDFQLKSGERSSELSKGLSSLASSRDFQRLANPDAMRIQVYAQYVKNLCDDFISSMKAIITPNVTPLSPSHVQALQKMLQDLLTHRQNDARNSMQRYAASRGLPAEAKSFYSPVESLFSSASSKYRDMIQLTAEQANLESLHKNSQL